MTSQERSENFNVAKHTFTQSVLINLPLTFLQTIILILLIPFSINFKVNNKLYGIENMLYSLMSRDYEVIGTIAVFSILSAIITFYFLFSKNAINVYFSLGVSRKTQFITRYSGGLSMLFVAPLIALTSSLIMNLVKMGYTPELVSAYLYFLVGFFVVAFVIYTITIMVISLCGTIAEGVCLSTLILFSPSIIFSSLNSIMKLFLFGNDYGRNMANTFYLLKKFSPLFFFVDDTKKYGQCNKNLFNPDNRIHEKLFPISPTLLILWFAFGIVVLYLSWTFYKKRRGEITGTMGVNKYLNFISAFILSFAAFSFTLNLGKENRLFIFFAIISSLITYLLCDLILLRNIKKVIKGYKKAALNLAICLAVLIIFATGGFGYSSRVPDPDRVEYVTMTYKGSPDYQISNGVSNFALSYSTIGVKDIKFESIEDINKIINLHKLIVNCGKKNITLDKMVTNTNQYVVRSDINIKYKLKNGSSITRYYDRTSLEILSQMLELDNTDAVKNVIANNLLFISRSPYTSTNSNKDAFQMRMYLN